MKIFEVPPKVFNQAAFAAFVIILLLFSFGQISYNDFFWHLSLGKWMIETGSFLTHDIFSLAFQGKEWLNGTWIFDGIIYYLFTYTGIWGLSALRFIIFGATFWILFKTIRLRSSLPAPLILAAFLLTIPLIRNFLRPEITSPLFTSFFLYALFKYKYKHSKLLYILPLVELLWVNTHGGFTLGILLPAIFFGSELLREIIRNRDNVLNALSSKPVRTYAMVTLVTAIASLVNPYGASIYTLLHQILSDRESLINIGEWQRLSWKSFLSVSLNSQLAFIIFGWLALSLMVRRTVSAAYNSTMETTLARLPLEEIALFTFLLFSTLEYVRGMHLFTIIAMLITLTLLKNNSANTPLTTYMQAPWTQGIFIVALGLTIFFQQDAMRLNVGPAIAKNIPESIQYLIEHKPEGNIINEYGAGSELSWLLYPHYKLFIDGRTPNVYDKEYYWRYRNILNENIFEKMEEEYNLTIATVNHGWGIVPLLEKKDWKLVFFDNSYSIYLAPTETNKVLVENSYELLKPSMSTDALDAICSKPDQKNKLIEEIEKNLREVTRPIGTFITTAKLALDCNGSPDEFERAASNMQSAIAAEPKNGEHYFYLASLQLKLDENEAALNNFKQSIHLVKTKENLTGMGITLHNMGRYKEAAKTFGRAIFAPGNFPPEYYQIYGRTSYQVDDNQKAVDLFRRYIDLIGKKNAAAQDYFDLSIAYRDAGDELESERYRQMAEDISTAEKR